MFVVSDIHGHFTALKAALDEKGFIENDDDHILIVCGDLFDRGTENREVFNFIKKLKNKILIRGNHEDILERILDEGYLNWTDYYNGLESTVMELLAEDAIDLLGDVDVRRHSAKIRAIKKLFSQMLDYFETDNYIFTHGWIPIKNDDGTLDTSLDWRRAKCSTWYDARFYEWQKFYAAGNATLSDKTIVCGHRTAQKGAMFDSSRTEDTFTEFYGDGVIAIDGCTVRSGVVNVLVLEEEIPAPSLHKLALSEQLFAKFTSGKKTLEILPLDEMSENIKVGDIIEYSLEEGSKTAEASVLGVYRYPSFEDALYEFSAKELGLSGKKNEKVIEAQRERAGEVLALRIKKK